MFQHVILIASSHFIFLKNSRARKRLRRRGLGVRMKINKTLFMRQHWEAPQDGVTWHVKKTIFLSLPRRRWSWRQRMVLFLSWSRWLGGVAHEKIVAAWANIKNNKIRLEVYWWSVAILISCQTTLKHFERKAFPNKKKTFKSFLASSAFLFSLAVDVT